MSRAFFPVVALALAIAAPACERDHHKRHGERWGAGSIQDVAEGQHVRVRVDGAAYPFVATQVEILATPDEAMVEEGGLEGALQAIDERTGTLTVLGVNVAVDSTTELRGIGDLSELAVGQAVRIRGRTGADGTFTASQIGLRTAQLEGIVLARVPGEDEIKIGVLGKTVVLGAETEVVHREPPRCDRDGHGHDEDDEDDEGDDD